MYGTYSKIVFVRLLLSENYKKSKGFKKLIHEERDVAWSSGC